MLVAAAGLIALTTAGMLMPPQQTLAAWTDAEVAKGTLTSGTVTPPTALTCGITGGQRFVTWTAPAAGGLDRVSYHVTLSDKGTGAVIASSNPTDAKQNLSPGGLLTIGVYTITVTSLGVGGWESTSITGTFTIVTSLITGCSVP